MGPADRRRDQHSGWPVVVVSMPFMDVHLPSIQLGLLKSLAVAAGFPARTLHANLNFAQRIGLDLYQFLSDYRGHMIGDWLFSLEAFPDTAPDPDSRMLAELADDLHYDDMPAARLRERLIEVRHVDVPGYLDTLLDTFPWPGAAVVGFSSTFQQNTASFALARRLKQRYPHIFTVFGGANFDGDMGPELVRTIDCIDAAVIGEADDAFPALLTALADGRDVTAIPGIACRVDGGVRVTPPLPPRQQLDDLPIPDYDEYFSRAEETGVLPHPGHRNVWIPIETARGCWWGAKQHCTFCGLNGDSMAFRSKSPERVLDELAQQVRRYRCFHFGAVDNVLDMSYFRGLFPLLVASETDYTFFYEVKANLSREQLRLLAQAGVTYIQPGLESLSSNVLRLMRKGVRAIQNVNLLRWSRYYDIRVSWNLLWGFPGETEQDYADQAAVIPHLVHLPPPAAADRIWLERFSPLFTGHGIAPIANRAPVPSYRYVYPGGIDLDRVAYFFGYQLDDGLPDDAYTGVRSATATWMEAWRTDEPPALTYWSAPHCVQVCDGRPSVQPGTYTFEGTLADVYLACCRKPTTAAAVRRRLDPSLPVEEVQELFGEFQQRGLMFLDGELALSLALPAVKSR